MTNRPPLVGHFDAKKHAYRQTQDGVVISFVVDPADITPEFAAAPLGICLKIGYAEYDPETGKAKEAPKRKRERVPFDELKPSQQAALLCKDAEFWRFLSDIGQPCWSETDASDRVRYACNVESRAEIKKDHLSGEMWNRFLELYRDWQTEQRYSGTPAYEREARNE